MIHPVEAPVTTCYSIDDLRKAVPAASCLVGLSGPSLGEKLQLLLGHLTRHATVSTYGERVTLEFHKLPEANLKEADRLLVRAAARAKKGEFQKAASLYRQVLTLCPSRQDARHALALILLKSRNTREGIETLIEILKIDPTDSRALAILGK